MLFLFVVKFIISAVTIIDWRPDIVASDTFSLNPWKWRVVYRRMRGCFFCSELISASVWVKVLDISVTASVSYSWYIYNFSPRKQYTLWPPSLGSLCHTHTYTVPGHLPAVVLWKAQPMKNKWSNVGEEKQGIWDGRDQRGESEPPGCGMCIRATVENSGATEQPMVGVKYQVIVAARVCIMCRAPIISTLLLASARGQRWGNPTVCLSPPPLYLCLLWKIPTPNLSVTHASHHRQF